MGKVGKVAQPNRKKASKTIRPHSASSQQGTLNFHTIEYGTKGDRPSDDGSRQYKKSKRNHHYPEGGCWSPHPDCSKRRKALATMNKHLTGDTDHPIEPIDLQPAPRPGSRVLTRPNLPTLCSVCDTNLEHWQHSWQHMLAHQQGGMSKKTYLTEYRS